MSKKTGVGNSATLLLASTVVLFANAARAMTFPQFDHMVGQDRQDYLNVVVESAHKVLVEEGRDADAAKMHKLFNDISPGSDLPLGEAELELNLDNARVRAAKKAIEKPDAPPVQVESALGVTLMKNDIKMTPDFVRRLVELTGSFKPKYPPLSLSLGEAIQRTQVIRHEKRGVIEKAMGVEENIVERDLGAEDDESRVSDAILSSAMLLPGSAQAMTFSQFDDMAGQDRQDFMSFMVDSAHKVLEEEGRDDDAAKVHKLFNDISPDSDLPLGEAELEMNLDNARVADAIRAAIEYPHLPPILVEAAMAVTLKKNGFELSPDFLKGFAQMTSTFKPKLPSLSNKADSPTPPPAVPPAPTSLVTPQPAGTVAPTNQVVSPATDDDPIGPGGFITPPDR